MSREQGTKEARNAIPCTCPNPALHERECPYLLACAPYGRCDRCTKALTLPPSMPGGGAAICGDCWRAAQRTNEPRSKIDEALASLEREYGQRPDSASPHVCPCPEGYHGYACKGCGGEAEFCGKCVPRPEPAVPPNVLDTARSLVEYIDANKVEGDLTPTHWRKVAELRGALAFPQPPDPCRERTMVPIEQWDAAEDRCDALAIEVIALRKVADAAIDVVADVTRAGDDDYIVDRELVDALEATLKPLESSSGGGQ